jgi:hypothetical protein
MAKKKAKALLRKKDTSFGSAYYERTSVPLPVEGRTGLSVHLSFEEGLKLQLSLQQALWELNRLDRRSPRSRSKSVALTMFPHQNRITVNMGTVKKRRNGREIVPPADQP